MKDITSRLINEYGGLDILKFRVVDQSEVLDMDAIDCLLTFAYEQGKKDKEIENRVVEQQSVNKSETTVIPQSLLGYLADINVSEIKEHVYGGDEQLKSWLSSWHNAIKKELYDFANNHNELYIQGQNDKCDQIIDYMEDYVISNDVSDGDILLQDLKEEMGSFSVGDKLSVQIGNENWSLKIVNINEFRPPESMYAVDFFDSKGTYVGDVRFVGKDFLAKCKKEKSAPTKQQENSFLSGVKEGINAYKEALLSQFNENARIIQETRLSRENYPNLMYLDLFEIENIAEEIKESYEIEDSRVSPSKDKEDKNGEER